MAEARTIQEATKKLRNRQREIALKKLPEDPYYAKLIADLDEIAQHAVMGSKTELTSLPRE